MLEFEFFDLHFLSFSLVLVAVSIFFCSASILTWTASRISRRPFIWPCMWAVSVVSLFSIGVVRTGSVGFAASSANAGIIRADDRASAIRDRFIVVLHLVIDSCGKSNAAPLVRVA